MGKARWQVRRRHRHEPRHRRGDRARCSRRRAAKVVCAARTLHEGEHLLEGSLEKTVADIKAAGGEATPVAVDISQPEECEKLIEAARDAYGPIDVLVNNAALTYFIPIKDYPLNGGCGRGR